jgi:hypothetical protein
VDFQEEECDRETESNSAVKEDYLFNYHKSKLSFGLILLEFTDAIKEGDGDRLHDVYKFALLLYKANGKTKYSYAILLYLCQIECLLSEEDAHSLKWNRFFNKHGKVGRNIPLDLRMEQLNKIVKTMWRSLGANLNEKSASRLADTLEPMEQILESVDNDCDLCDGPGYRSHGDAIRTVELVTKDLVDAEVFKKQPGRPGHPSYSKMPSNLLKKLDYRDLHNWMREHLQLWESVYTSNKKSNN